MVDRGRLASTVLWLQFGCLCEFADRLGNSAAWYIRLDDAGRSCRGRGWACKWRCWCGCQNGKRRSSGGGPLGKHRRRKFRTSVVFLLRDPPLWSKHLGQFSADVWVVRRSGFDDRPDVNSRRRPDAGVFWIFQLSITQLPRRPCFQRHRGVKLGDLHQRSTITCDRPSHVQRAAPIRRKIECECEFHSFAGLSGNSFNHLDEHVHTFIAVQRICFCDNIP